MKSQELFIIRLILACIWWYQGCWIKVIQCDPHHLAVVQSLPLPQWFTPARGLALIGWAETLLGIGIATGLWCKWVNRFQLVALVTMNVIGIAFAGDKIPEGWGLLLMNLPMLMLAWLLMRHGPGAWALKLSP